MKNLRALIAAGILAGSLVFDENICGQTIDSLTIYNQKNEQIYENFKEFMATKSKKSVNWHKYGFETSFFYVKFIEQIKYSANCFVKGLKNEQLLLEKQFPNDSSIVFRDIDLNGLDEKDMIGKYSYLPGVYNGAIKIKEMSLDKKIEIAKEYTNLLKEIMRNAKYDKY